MFSARITGKITSPMVEALVTGTGKRSHINVSYENPALLKSTSGGAAGGAGGKGPGGAYYDAARKNFEAEVDKAKAVLEQSKRLEKAAEETKRLEAEITTAKAKVQAIKDKPKLNKFFNFFYNWMGPGLVGPPRTHNESVHLLLKDFRIPIKRNDKGLVVIPDNVHQLIKDQHVIGKRSQFFNLPLRTTRGIMARDAVSRFDERLKSIDNYYAGDSIKRLKNAENALDNHKGFEGALLDRYSK